MKVFHARSIVEQLALHLREEILRGSMGDTMPGVHELVRTLGTSPNTVMGAVRLLEKEGLLKNQGSGRRSRIVIPKNARPPGLRMEFLLYEKADLAIGYHIEIKHRLLEAGHLVNFSSKYLKELDLDVKRVASHVAKTEADAWLVLASPYPVLKWFAAQPFPALAMFGQVEDLPMAGIFPRKGPALVELIHRLVSLGHRRIVLLVREERRAPQAGSFESRFLELLGEAGIRTGPYNLPDWEVTPEGLCQCLDSLFQVTPPTALIIDEPAIFMAARQHLSACGINAPKDLSMVCLDSDPVFEWSNRPVSHVSWDSDVLVRRVVQWADNIARGKEDRRQTRIKTQFVIGGTIGPPPNAAP